MKRPLQAAALAVALFTASCGGGSGSSESSSADGQTPTAPVEEAAPDEATADSPLTFTAATVGGGQIDANSLAGQDVVLWFWAPW